MAVIPRVIINNVEGVTWPASGAGPGDGIIPGSVLSGNNASTPSTTQVDLSADNPDLSSVPTDYSAVIVLWDGLSTYYWGVITAVDNTTKTVTCSGSAYSVWSDFPSGLTGYKWAIGGKLSTVPQWLKNWFNNGSATYGIREVRFEYTGTDYTDITFPGLRASAIVGTGNGRPRIVLTTDSIFCDYISHGYMKNIEVVGPGKSISTQPMVRVYYRGGGVFYNCKFSGFSSLCTRVTSDSNRLLHLIDCHIHDMKQLYGGSYMTVTLEGCHIENLGRLGYLNMYDHIICRRCIIRNSGGADGYDHLCYCRANNHWYYNSFQFYDCVLYNIGGHLFFIYNVPHPMITIRNSVAYSISGYVYYRQYHHGLDQMTMQTIDRFAWGSATSGRKTSGDPFEQDPGYPKEIVLTQDPFVDAPNGNFALNDYGKTVLQEFGLPQTWPGLPNTVSYPDIGAVQSKSTSKKIFVTRPVVRRSR